MPDTTAEIRAVEWWNDNPDVRDKFTSYALDQAAHGRRISVAYLAEIVRAKDRVNRRGEPVKFNNSFRPVVARLLIREHPEIKPFIEIRKAESDHILTD